MSCPAGTDAGATGASASAYVPSLGPNVRVCDAEATTWLPTRTSNVTGTGRSSVDTTGSPAAARISRGLNRTAGTAEANSWPPTLSTYDALAGAPSTSAPMVTGPT